VGKLKDKVYETNSHVLEDSRLSILREISAISGE
jgi:hypothetical protein